MFNKLVTVFLFLIVAVSANAASYGSLDVVIPTKDNRPVPWPWSLAQDFPWGDVQGLWRVQQDDYTSYFSLKVIKQKAAGNYLQIKQYDGETCRILAEGVGFEINQRVSGQMSGRHGETYRVRFTTFAEEDSPAPKLISQSPYDGVMVLSMGVLDSAEDMVHIQIARVSPYISQKFCREDVKSSNY